MVKAVIFDLDDTLILEKDYIISGFKHIAKLMCIKTGINENQLLHDLMDLYEENPKQVFNRLYEKYNMVYTDEMITELVNEYRCHLPDIRYYDDVLPCLNALKESGIKTGIITDGYEVSQRQKLKVIDADKYFDAIILTDELGREYWKPHPRPFEIMKHKLDVEFDEMVYVGDNPEKDFYISRFYPIKTVRINRNGIYTNKAYYKGVRETFYIKNMQELLNILKKNN